jgi:RNA polymerase sigma-70 factor (ECF subfamily)
MSLKSLLFTIVKNKCLNKVKSLQVRTRVHSDIIEKYKEQFESPDFYLENELYEIYSKALNKLPKTYREAFEMSREQQLTHKEIAEILNVSPQTVNYRLGKALEILRAELKDYLPLLLLLFTSSNI